MLGCLDLIQFSVFFCVSFLESETDIVKSYGTEQIKKKGFSSGKIF